MSNSPPRGGDDEFVILSHGMLGYGFPESSVESALRVGIDLIAVDAGSTDPGPYYLGSNALFGDKDMIRRDLSLLLDAQQESGAKLFIGSAGGGGTNSQVDQTLELLKDELAKKGRKRRIAVIYSEVSKDELRQALRAGQIHTFESGRALTEEDIEASTQVVAQLGVEPMIAALQDDPDIVLCGRAWDPANIAALPIARGLDRGLSVHAGKILECGSLAVSPPQGADLIMGRIRADDFIIEPCRGSQRCTVESVSAHTFYEKSDPLHLPGPGGQSDLRESTYEQIDPRRVRVSGSRFIPDAVPMLKLEGARHRGWRNVLIAGLRDPIMISHIDTMQRDAVQRARELLAGRIDPSQYEVTFRRYGLDGVMGALEPERRVPHEIGLVIEAVGRTEKIAATVIATLRSLLLHWPYPGRIATAGNLALPFSPAELPGGPVYDFHIYHLMECAHAAGRFRHRMEVVQ